MTEYNAGEIWEAVKGETVTRGRLREDELGLHLWVGDSGRTPENLESYGFTLSLIEKAAAVVVLPTERGWYLGKYVDSPSGVIAVELLGTGEWVDNTDSRYLSEWFMAQLSDLTRLEPVSETAKKVLDRLDEWEIHEEVDSREVFAKVAAEFGVEL